MPNHRQLGEDGAIELSAPDGTRISLRRLRPGLILLRIAGDDRGALGAAPFQEIEREMAAYQPMELFFDLRDALGASSAVSGAWTDFFTRHRARLRRVSILAGSRHLALTVEVAKLFSRTGELIQIYSDAQLFQQTLAVAAGRPVQLAASRPTPVPSPRRAPAVDVVREVLTDRSVRLRSSSCSYLFERLRPGVLLVTVSGDDYGEFGVTTIDELAAALGGTPLALFIDARRSTGAVVATADTWTGFLRTHRAALKLVRVLTASNALRLTVEISQHLLRGDDLLRVIADPVAFEAAIAAEVPGFTLG